VCHKATNYGLSRWVVLALAGTLGASAQTDWRRIGTSAIESHLAGPASGPVANVWYAADGSALYARTISGRTLATEDFENWEPAAAAPDPPATFPREPVRKPELAARYFSTSASSQEIWGLGRQLYRSDDGQSWQTLTSYRLESVVGGGIRGVAIAPNDPGQLVVANESGVWRSMDAGLTWASLNLLLPNLSVERILATPSGGHPAQILAGDLGVLELLPGSALWRAGSPSWPQYDALRKQNYSVKVQAAVTAYAESGDGRQVYAGADDGRIWRSVDGGGSFPTTSATLPVPGHRVQRLWVDPANPLVALAALAGDGPHVLRTFDGGNFWEPLDSASLPAAEANSVTADAAAHAVYVATDKGVYWTSFDLESGVSTSNLTWTNVSERLPQARAVDVALDAAGVQLYAALEGYGVYGAAAPHRATGLRLVNTADFSTRAASPGSLVSILGQKVNAVTSGTMQYPLWNNSQIQVPFEAVGPTVSLALDTSAGRMTRDLQVLPVSPAIFVGSDGVPMILDADSGMPLEGNVARPGQRLEVLLNGLGKVRPDWPTGVAAPDVNTPEVVARVQAYLDRSEVSVARATLAPGYVGYYLVEVQLPVVANYGAMELFVTADGQESNHVQIVIAP
jgi:uncharacterized protein (TIGR03437 family)